MGWQPEKGDNERNPPGDEAMEGVSPLLDIHKRSLFRWIEGQRAALFADIEAGMDSHAGRNSADGSESKGNMGNNSFTPSKRSNRGGDGSPSSGFADLSTWCCDAYPHIRSNSLPLEAHRARLLAIADQPTLVLPRLVTAPFHVADLPTEPNLPAVSAGVAGSGLSIVPTGAKK